MSTIHDSIESVETITAWDDIAGPSADQLSFIPETEREYEADRMYAAWTRTVLESSNAARLAAAERRASLRVVNSEVIGARAAYATVRTLNVIHRRRNAVAIIGNGISRIDSIEKNETMVHGNDVDKVTQIAYPLLRVDNVDTVTVWPVRLTVDAMGKIDNAIVSAFRAVALVDSFPNCIAPQYAMDRAMDHADKIARSHGAKCIEWDGTSAGMIDILLTHAGARSRVLADRSRNELVMRRAHKTNRAVAKSAADDRAADLIVLLGSMHRTQDGVYSALVPNGDTEYALAILDGKALAEYLERPLSAPEKMLLSRKRADIKADTPRATRGENVALAKLGEDIKRRASRAR